MLHTNIDWNTEDGCVVIAHTIGIKRKIKIRNKKRFIIYYSTIFNPKLKEMYKKYNIMFKGVVI